MTIDLALARVCVQASAEAYTAAATIQGMWATVRVTTAAAVALMMRPTIVAFRGSASVRDWITDARVYRRNVGVGLLHQGFLDSVQNVFYRVCKIVDKKAAPVIVTGHSKGGAEALICAWLLARSGRTVQAVVTFGGPRVGDAQWKAHYNSTALGAVTQRWVHEEDIVTRLPAWCMGYRHVGQECFMSSFGGVEINPPLWRKAASDLWGTFWGYKHGEIEQASDHPIAKYLGHIERL